MFEHFRYIAVAALLASLVAAQNTTLPHPGDAVSTGKPIDGNYDGFYRPQIHFSPPRGFMNDPNGLFYDAYVDPRRKELFEFNVLVLDSPSERGIGC